MAPRPELVLVRHGETEWSRTGRHTGNTDVSLTDEGRAQARLLGDRLRGRAFTRVLTSPLTRALDTCRLAGFGEQAEVCDDLREWDYGIYEGRTSAEIRQEIEGWTVWTHPITRGETIDELGRRVDRVIDLIRSVDGDVLLFAHGHVLRVLATRWCQLTAINGRVLALDTASLSTLGYERDTPVIRDWNKNS
jgi:broad specificity phosphatase PhoE